LTNPVLFYTGATIYFAGLSGAATPTSIPWVNDFAKRPAGADVVVLNSDLGSDTAGLYVMVPNATTGRKVWRQQLTMLQLTAILAAAQTITLVLNASSTTTYPAPAVVYGNGQVIAGGAVTASSTAVYLIAQPALPTSAVYTFATLPSAVTAGAGARAFITDASATTFASAAAGGGANKVPVYSDGAAWHIG